MKKILQALRHRKVFSMQSVYDNDLYFLKRRIENEYSRAYSSYMHELNDIKFKNEDECVLAEIEKSCEGMSDEIITAVIDKAEKTLTYAGRHDFTATTRKELSAATKKFDLFKASLEDEFRVGLLELTVLYPRVRHVTLNQTYSSN